MKNKEELLKFFEKHGAIDNVESIHSIKSIGAVLDIIDSEECFDYYINQSVFKVRNPYKTLYPIKLNKDFKTNILKRLEESPSIRGVNKSAERQYYKSVIFMAIIMNKMGYQFSDEEIERISKCYEKIDKKSKKRLDSTTQRDYQFLISKQKYSDKEIEKYSKEMEEALKLITDDNKIKEFIHETMRNSKMDKTDALTDILKLNGIGHVHINKEANINCSKIDFISDEIDRLGLFPDIANRESKDNGESEDKKTYDEEKRAEYKKKIKEIYESAVRERKPGEEMAQCLYRKLNEATAYNTIAFSWSQDNRNVAEIIKNDKSDDINESNHYITCHSWTDAMYDLLSEAQYEAYIIGGNAHRYIVFFDENNDICVADGTDMPAANRPSWYWGADLSRTKLGLHPDNLYKVKHNNGYFGDDEILYMHDGTVNQSALMYKIHDTNVDFDVDDFKDEDGNYDYKAMFQFIDRNPGIVTAFVREAKEKFADREKIDVINDILQNLTKGHEDDDLLLLNCTSNLLFAINSDEYSNIKSNIDNLCIFPVYSIKCTYDLYKMQGNKSRLVPLLYIKENDILNYYVWDEEGKFTGITEKEVIDRINSGVYHSSKNTKRNLSSLNRNILPGIRVPYKRVEDEEAIVFGKRNSNNDDGQEL